MYNDKNKLLFTMTACRGTVGSGAEPQIFTLSARGIDPATFWLPAAPGCTGHSLDVVRMK
jgi:hypothetical protein